MNPRFVIRLAVCLVIIVAAGCGGPDPAPAVSAPTTPAAAPEAADNSASILAAAVAPPTENLGSITGHVAVQGKAPGNRVIRMGVDPKCAALTRGKTIVDDQVVANLEGDLANVFVYLDGDIPLMTPPSESVLIDQQDCVYRPRVVGIQVGQTVEIRNSDGVSHNLHGRSSADNEFNVGQERAGEVFTMQPKAAEIMLRLTCDIHRWMQTFIGVVGHPYFDVTSQEGDFRIDGVPAGTYTLRIWHEVFGEMDQMVEVRADQMSTVNFEYPEASRR